MGDLVDLAGGEDGRIAEGSGQQEIGVGRAFQQGRGYPDVDYTALPGSFACRGDIFPAVAFTGSVVQFEQPLCFFCLQPHMDGVYQVGHVDQAEPGAGGAAPCQDAAPHEAEQGTHFPVAGSVHGGGPVNGAGQCGIVVGHQQRFRHRFAARIPGIVRMPGGDG